MFVRLIQRRYLQGGGGRGAGVGGENEGEGGGGGGRWGYTTHVLIEIFTIALLPDYGWIYLCRVYVRNSKGGRYTKLSKHRYCSFSCS